MSKQIVLQTQARLYPKDRELLGSRVSWRELV